MVVDAAAVEVVVGELVEVLVDEDVEEVVEVEVEVELVVEVVGGVLVLVEVVVVVDVTVVDVGAVVEVVVVEVVVGRVVVVVLVGPVNCTVADPGGVTPRLRNLSRRTCMMAMSTTTSGLPLSRSLISFSAIAILSGVSRMMMAFCEFTWDILENSSTVRRAVVMSCMSVAAEIFER